MRRLWPFAAIAAVALALWAPMLFVVRPGDSWGYDLNWSTQFSGLVASGDLYPRWTPTSFFGLGAPTFDFYPPLGFWVAALVRLASGGALGPVLELKLAFLALIGGSGLAMYAWLRTAAAAPAAVLGAILFMAAPYHLDDLYVRGAFAELAAFALLPLLALGLSRTAAGARLGPLGLALAWAGLILAHLPTALLAGVFLVAPYGLMLLAQSQRRLVFAARAGAALALGTGLAAIYLVPALALQPFVSADYWWSERFQAADRLFLNPKAWTMALEPYLAAVSIGETAAAIAISAIAWRANRRSVAIWGVVAAVVFAAIAGLLPGFWSLPLMSKVQFPWRAIAVAEIAVATVVAWAPWPKSLAGRLPAICLAALVAANLAQVGKDLASGPPTAPVGGYGAAFPTSVDAPEYLPKGMLTMTPAGPMPAVDLARLTALPLASRGAATARPDGSVDVRLAPGPTAALVVRRFYFPAWTATCDGQPVTVAPSDPGRLVSFTPPASAKACDLAIGRTPSEQLGGWLSLASLALILAWAAFAARRRLSPSPG
jgi:hypothetical protein